MPRVQSEGTLNLQFRVESHADSQLRTVRVSGELDQGTAPELREVLGEALGESTGAVLIDLGECRFIDSTGLSLLIEAKRRLAEDERGFGVCCPDVDVRRLLELTGIDQAVSLFDTRDDAIAALREAA